MKPYIVFDIETTGLSPWYGDIVTCICAKDSEGNSFRGVNRTQGTDGEKGLIQQFMDWVGGRPAHKLVSVNGKGFDIPFILTAAYLTGVTPLDHNLLLKREHMDLMTLTSKWISLNDLAALLLGSEHKKTGSGFQAIKLYEQEAYTELVQYCIHDVELTEKVYLKYVQIHSVEPVVAEKNKEVGDNATG